MSSRLARKKFIISTALGNMVVERELVVGHTVEDMIKDKAESQARAVQMVNVGKDLDGNSPLPVDTLPTMFGAVDEELEDG